MICCLPHPGALPSTPALVSEYNSSTNKRKSIITGDTIVFKYCHRKWTLFILKLVAELSFCQTVPLTYSKLILTHITLTWNKSYIYTNRMYFDCESGFDSEWANTRTRLLLSSDSTLSLRNRFQIVLYKEGNELIMRSVGLRFTIRKHWQPLMC